jgi:hypothetical protein
MRASLPCTLAATLGPSHSCDGDFTSEEETWPLIEQMTCIHYLVMIYPYKVKVSLSLAVDSLECLSVNLDVWDEHWDVRTP